MSTRNSKTIDKRQKKTKELLLEQLRRLPIVQIACEKLGVARATYYRWLENDKDFAKAATTAIEEGALMINDLAEAQLISAIKDKNFPAISFWLRNRHRAYANKVQIEAHVKTESRNLTEEEQDRIADILKNISSKRAEIIKNDTYDEPNQ